MGDLLCDPGPKLTATLADIERIAGAKDPVLRNLWITQRYHDLSESMSGVVDSQNVNWSTFATWASKTAGASIRNQELPEFFLDFLKAEEHLHTEIANFSHALLGVGFNLDLDLLDVARDTVHDVSLQVANGNLKVFHELAPIFARFADDLCETPVYDEASITKFVDMLRPGPAESDGQDLLKLAFRHYYEARASSEPKQKAELMLLANCQIGLHEQTRLQPNIKAAIDAPIAQLFTERIQRKAETKTPHSFWEPLRRMVASHLSGLLKTLKAGWEQVATRYAMRLMLPNGTSIPLGQDISVSEGGFPEPLRRLENPDLLALLQRYHEDLDSLHGSGAENWSTLDDRMRFIVDLFRSRQQETDLFQKPFTQAQLDALSEGRIPDGPL